MNGYAVICHPYRQTDQERWIPQPDIFCPCCGRQSVWCEDSSGDYHVGPSYGCAACGSFGYLWEGHQDSAAPYAKRLEAIQYGERELQRAKEDSQQGKGKIGDVMVVDGVLYERTR